MNLFTFSNVLFKFNFTDIQFWKSRKSLEGLSVRSVFFNVFQSVVVVLYVLDNETNMIVKISVIVGLAIEIWKIQKVVDITVRILKTFFWLCVCTMKRLMVKSIIIQIKFWICAPYKNMHKINFLTICSYYKSI